MQLITAVTLLILGRLLGYETKISHLLLSWYLISPGNSQRDPIPECGSLN